jgi:hypothetical protein
MATPSTLSPAQARFADAHQSNKYVQPAPPTHGCGFVYRERQGCTDRWLVAPDGAQLDWTAMRHDTTTV